MTQLYVRSESDFREATGEEIVARAQAVISQRFRKGAQVLTAPSLTKAFLQIHLGFLDYEVFGVLHLDSRNRLIAAENLFRGTLDASMVYTREVVQSVLTHRAASVIFYHNHPSGMPDPSQADIAITQRLKQALELFDVRVLDHLVIAETIFSFSDAGML